VESAKGAVVKAVVEPESSDKARARERLFVIMVDLRLVKSLLEYKLKVDVMLLNK
jgi:hypothetical protein